MSKLVIGIVGIIGAGKTMLTEQLGEVMGLRVYKEEVGENPDLEDFYADMAKHSFRLQIIWSKLGGIQDRTIYEDAIFAKILKEDGLMEERDYVTYLNLFDNMSNFMRKPDVIVYLQVTPEIAKERIRTRGREMEKNITLEYLQNLHAGYEEFIDTISVTIPVIRVDWTIFKDPKVVAMEIREDCCERRIIRDMK